MAITVEEYKNPLMEHESIYFSSPPGWRVRRQLKKLLPPQILDDFARPSPFEKLKQELRSFLSSIGVAQDCPLYSSEAGLLLSYYKPRKRGRSWHACIWFPTNTQPESPEEGKGFGLNPVVSLEQVSPAIRTRLPAVYQRLLGITNGVRKMVWPMEEGIRGVDQLNANAEELDDFWLEATFQGSEEPAREYLRDALVVVNDGFGNCYGLDKDDRVLMLEHEMQVVVKEVFPDLETLFRKYFENMYYLLYDPY